MVRNEKGVTLVELLIVIVILGIIAAISVPAVGNIVENAERDAVVTEARNVRDAAQLYCSQNSGESVCDDNTDKDSDAVFSNVQDSEDDVNLEDEGSLEGFDGDYSAYYDEQDGFIIAIHVDGYSYVGPENEIDEEGAILEDDEAWDGTEDDLPTDADSWSPGS